MSISTINKQALKIFDKIVVATSDNVNKNYHFSVDERLSIIKNSLFMSPDSLLNIAIEPYPEFSLKFFSLLIKLSLIDLKIFPEVQKISLTIFLFF